MVTDEEISPIPYREAIRSLLYLSITSRPDISFAVNYLSRFHSKPVESYWKIVKRIFAYLKETYKFEIFFNGDSDRIEYMDSDYGGDMYKSSCVASRSSCMLRTKTTSCCFSTVEAEFFDSEQSTTLCIDNQSAISQVQKYTRRQNNKGQKAY